MIRDGQADFDLHECTFKPKTNKRYSSMDFLSEQIRFKSADRHLGRQGHENNFH